MYSRNSTQMNFSSIQIFTAMCMNTHTAFISSAFLFDCSKLLGTCTWRSKYTRIRVVFCVCQVSGLRPCVHTNLCVYSWQSFQAKPRKRDEQHKRWPTDNLSASLPTVLVQRGGLAHYRVDQQILRIPHQGGPCEYFCPLSQISSLCLIIYEHVFV
jgi:hypothetical protein